MVSRDQLGRLGFDSMGGVGDIQLGYAFEPWLDVRVGMGGGGFPSRRYTGGLLDPLLGVAVGLPAESVRPWLQVNAGMAFTGPLLRPMLQAAIGVDLRMSNAFTLGPLLGYSHVFQTDGPTHSTDAGFLWFGVVVGFEPQRRQHGTQPTKRVIVESRSTSHVKLIAPEPRAEPALESPADHELTVLLDKALPSQQNSWLAPILFEFDSAELQPQGVAMLHEVARELTRRPELTLIEIQGYADRRGAADYNQKLSERRATAVLEWLVNHGIERERLRVSAAGASALVEPGDSEPEHEQNRRVVFRVIESAAP